MNKTYDYVGTVFDNESNPKKVTVALTMGNKALSAGYSAVIILMIDAVTLACSEKFDNINAGEPFKPAKELLESFLAKGGDILVCESCRVNQNISKEVIDSRFGYVNGDGVVELVMNAKGSLQVS